MHAFPSGARAWSRGLPGEAMTDRFEAADLVDVEVEQFNERNAFVAHHRGRGLWRLARARARHAAEHGFGAAGALCDVAIDQAFSPARKRMGKVFRGDPPRFVRGRKDRSRKRIGRGVREWASHSGEAFTVCRC